MCNYKSSTWNRWIQKAKKLSLLVFPTIFLVLVVIVHFSNGKFYLQFTDPEYFHLFNGLNLSILNLAVDYIDHPGTTVQVLFAVSAHIVNLLLPGSNLISNALNSPEDFIHGANILLNIIIAVSLFLLGFYTCKYSRNVFLAILLQLTPFFSIKVLIVAARILPESVIIIPILVLILFIIKYIYDSGIETNSKKYVMAFAIIGGIGFATKLLYFPFLIIPLFLLRSKKVGVQYLIYTIVAAIIFAFPLFVNFSKSWDWYSNMLIHSGKWGSGEANIINFSEVPDHLMQIWQMDRALFIIVGLASIQLLVFYRIKLLRNQGETSKLIKRTLLAVIAVITLSVLLVAKHFALHYVIPVLIFKAFLIFLMTGLLLEVFRSQRVKKYISLVVLLCAFFLIIPQLRQLSTAVQLKKNNAIKFEERAYLLKDYNKKDNILIISSHYRGSPFIQSAIAGGFMLSGQLRSTFKNEILDKFPSTYLYVDWSDQFYYWDEFEDAHEFVDTQKPVYIFIGEGKEKNLRIILDRISSSYPAYSLDLEVLNAFKNPDETFYELKLNEN